MYLYFNKKGILTTVIPHGDVVRQGNDLHLTFCVDTDFFADKTPNSELSWTMNVKVRQPGKRDYNGPFLPHNRETAKFKKTLDSEITYDLQNDTYYYMFLFTIDSSLSTSIPGNIELFVSLHSVELDGNNQVISENHEYEGKVDLFVEKVLGYGKTTTAITATQYEYLLKQINALQIGNQQIINMINGTDVDLDPFIKRYDSLYEFPAFGDLKTIYIANNTSSVYIWTGIGGGYKNICNFEDIETIDGGDAHGRKNNE